MADPKDKAGDAKAGPQGDRANDRPQGDRQQPPKADAKADAGGKAADKARKFVVLHTQVGPHARGAVVTADQFGDDDARDANLRRLLHPDVKAIRPATEEESALDRVEEPEPAAEPTATARAAADRDRVRDLENELNEMRAKDADRVALMAAKDRQIAELKKELAKD